MITEPKSDDYTCDEWNDDEWEHFYPGVIGNVQAGDVAACGYESKTSGIGLIHPTRPCPICLALFQNDMITLDHRQLEEGSNNE